MREFAIHFTERIAGFKKENGRESAAEKSAERRRLRTILDQDLEHHLEEAGNVTGSMGNVASCS
jgi:hypothetical protein